VGARAERRRLRRDPVPPSDRRRPGVVAWHELARHGITVAGAPIADLAIWTSDEALTRFTRDNLDTY